MDDVQAIRNDLKVMEKKMSLLQISKQSGINYVTLRNIKGGVSKRVTKGVKDRFEAFKSSFNPDAPKAAPAKAAPAKTAKKTVKKAAAKKTAKKVAVKVKPAAKKAAKKKPGPKPGRKPGRKPGVKQAVAPKAAPSKLDFASPVLGQALDREIEIAEARLEYLKSLKEIEIEFLKAVGRK